MTESFQVRLLQEPDKEVLDQVESLFIDLYEYMTKHGLSNSLTIDGARKWRTSLERTMGRLGALVIAESDNKIIGFSRGVIRLSPDHLIGEKLGFVDHTFVKANWRAKGVGRQVFKTLEVWFYSKGVQKIELQVLCENSSAVNAWLAMGFKPELIQMQKRLSNPNS